MRAGLQFAAVVPDLRRDMNRSILVAGALVLLAGCGTDRAGDVEQPPSAASAPTAVEPSGTSPAPPAPPPSDPSNASPTPAPPPPDSGNASPPPAETLKLALTPALPEGPYYPAESQRPSDRDADLLLLTGSPAVARKTSIPSWATSGSRRSFARIAANSRKTSLSVACQRR